MAAAACVGETVCGAPAAFGRKYQEVLTTRRVQSPGFFSMAALPEPARGLTQREQSMITMMSSVRHLDDL